MWAKLKEKYEAPVAVVATAKPAAAPPPPASAIMGKAAPKPFEAGASGAGAKSAAAPPAAPPPPAGAIMGKAAPKAFGAAPAKAGQPQAPPAVPTVTSVAFGRGITSPLAGAPAFGSKPFGTTSAAASPFGAKPPVFGGKSGAPAPAFGAAPAPTFGAAVSPKSFLSLSLKSFIQVFVWL